MTKKKAALVPWDAKFAAAAQRSRLANHQEPVSKTLLTPMELLCTVPIGIENSDTNVEIRFITEQLIIMNGFLEQIVDKLNLEALNTKSLKYES